MGRIIRSHDDLPTREYHDFLKRFNRLTDCSWFWQDHHENRGRFENDELELLRAYKGGIVYPPEDTDCNEGVSRSLYTLTQTRLAEHRREKRKRKAVWISNDNTHDTLMMLIDLDKKVVETDVDGAALYIVEKYLGGRGYIEISTAGEGRHVYFFVDVRFVKRSEFVAAVKLWYGRLHADNAFQDRFALSFDDVPVYGIPTVWKDDQSALMRRIAYRGNQLKVPYLPRGRADYALLMAEAQRPLSGAKLVEWAKRTQAQNPSLESSPLLSFPLPSNRRVAQKQKPQYQRPNEDSGQKRRSKLYAKMKRQNPGLTEEEFVRAYAIRTVDNGGEEKVRKDFRHMEQTFVIRKADTRKIDMSKYLDVVTRVVPPLALATPKRRTKLSIERVAQFIAVKMHDAQNVGEYQAASARDTMIDFWRSLKDQGMVDWTLTVNAHSFLMRVSLKYGLLEIVEDYTAPSSPGAKNGRCRRIGPGKALGEEYERYEFTRRRLQADAVRKDLRGIGGEAI